MVLMCECHHVNMVLSTFKGPTMNSKAMVRRTETGWLVVNDTN